MPYLYFYWIYNNQKVLKATVGPLRDQAGATVSGEKWEAPRLGGIMSGSISRVLSRTIIHLRRTSPFA